MDRIKIIKCIWLIIIWYDFKTIGQFIIAYNPLDNQLAYDSQIFTTKEFM